MQRGKRRLRNLPSFEAHPARPENERGPDDPIARASSVAARGGYLPPFSFFLAFFSSALITSFRPCFWA